MTPAEDKTNVRVALIGAGRWGRNYLRTIPQLTDCRLAAVVDPDTAALAGVRGDSNMVALPAVELLLATDLVSAAVIATPDETHHHLARLCLLAGLDVLVEKPMATSAVEAQELTSIAACRGLILAIGHTSLYQPHFAAIQHELAQRQPPIQVSTLRTSRGRMDPGSDVLRDLAPHDIALGVSLFGSPTGVRGFMEVANRFRFELDFREGTKLKGVVAWRAEDPVRSFTIDGTGPHRDWREPVGLPTDPRAQPLFRQCFDFVTACRSRTRPLADADLGCVVAACLDALAESAELGGATIETVPAVAR